MIETAMLPLIIQPIKDVTFVVKQSLLEYPVFRHIMRSREPIAVKRENPREDLKAVLNGGIERLRAGISIVIFPQARRSETFDPAHFNTIGMKLAQKVGAPVIPVALMTNALHNGKYLKDFGKIDPSRIVHFAFGAPFTFQGRGQQEHQQIIDFVQSKLRQWATTEL
jgi:1-acyl-sn-glycerol-3-phosphate acyltransferase